MQKSNNYLRINRYNMDYILTPRYKAHKLTSMNLIKTTRQLARLKFL